MAPKLKKEKKQLTPEEKKAKADLMALKEEEVRKNKEAATKAHLFRLQKLEEQYSKENMRVIHDHWRKVMRVAKVEELRTDIHTLSEYYNHQVQHKDSVIKDFLKQMQDAEEQRQMAFNKHLQIIDGLIDLHNTRMKEMYDEFQEKLQNMKEEFDSERMSIVDTHEKQKKELNDMMRALENDFKEAENELRQEFEASREEIKNKNTEDYNVMKLSLESSIEELERKIDDTHQSYLESTNSKTEAFKKMVEKDKITARLIEQRMRKLIYLHERIAYRRAKIATDSEEWEATNKSMRDQKDQMNQHYRDLKRKISRLQATEHEDLKTMSKISEEIKSDLSNKLKMAERIIKLGDLNSKLELEHEKIFPFDPLHLSAFQYTQGDDMPDAIDWASLNSKTILPLLEASIQGKGSEPQFIQNFEQSHKEGKPSADRLGDNISNICTASYAMDEHGNKVDEEQYLSNFHRRYNKVTLDKMSLELQKKKLISENSNLKASLKEILDEILGSSSEMVKKYKVLVGEDCLKDVSRPNTLNDLMVQIRNA